MRLSLQSKTRILKWKGRESQQHIYTYRVILILVKNSRSEEQEKSVCARTPRFETKERTNEVKKHAHKLR